jgi:histidine triad (HIT) family protein
MTDCIFCAIVAGTAPAVLVHKWDDAVAILPLNPVTSGHTLVIPTVHVADWTVDPKVTGMVAARAAEIAPAGASNLITSAGWAATQTVRHLHFHIVPRRAGDRLPLPWTPQQAGGQP